MSIGNEQTKIAAASEEDRPEKVLVAILTDGHENKSKEYDKSKVFEMVEKVQKDGWEVLYLGADKASIDDAAAYGVCRKNAYCFDGNYVNADGITVSGCADSFRTMSSNSTSYRASNTTIKS